MAISLIDPFMNPEAHKIIGELETYSKTVRSMSLHDRGCYESESVKP